MYTDLFGLYEGEIVKVQSNEEDSAKKNVVRYLCLVELTNDSQVLVPNVVAPTMFGGIADYVQARHMAAADSGEEFSVDPSDAKNDAQVGTRVGIMFLGGHQSRPVITCFLPHPNQTKEIDAPDSDKPKMVFQLNGVRVEIDPTGQLKFAHKGAPKVKFAPQGGDGLLGAAADAAGAIAGALSVPGDDNPALEPADQEEYTTLEFLDGGIVRLRDSLGQLIEMDREQGRIYIANNDKPSTDSSEGSFGPQIATNSTDSEYVLLDRDRKLVLINARDIAQIYSFNKRKDVTDGNHTHKIKGNEEITVFGDKVDSILGGWKVDVTTGMYELEASKAKIKLGQGKIGIGGPAGELVEQLIAIVEELLKQSQDLSTHLHIGNLGFPTSPPQTAANYVAINAKLDLIKLILKLISGGI